MAENNIKMTLSPRQTLDGQRVRRISGSAMTIATWNVKSIYCTYKMVNIEREMLRLKINILGVSESRHQGTGILVRDDTVVYYSGNNDKNHYNGVAVIISRHLHHQVHSFLPISDRVLVLELKAKPRNIQIVQVYAPTANATDEDNELFYEQVETALKYPNPHNIILVQGDFNAKIGEGKVSDIVGSFGLGKRNDRGDRFLQFCEEHGLIISNTHFKQPPRRLYTWSSPLHSLKKIVRNQIDYILINRRYRNSLTSVKTYPGADIGTDHNPVVASVRCNMKILKPRSKRQ
ncbi:unnamed protein product [Parnassius mnemosyne]|uniref:Endonuclease/exonuclease/phosphatase domain-containing protein n=1 Tax=Parnassius mnemosyne TaxID=213953 RepID=A0AAV1LIS9_9NEOP